MFYIQFVLHQPLVQSIKRDVDVSLASKTTSPLALAIKENNTTKALELIKLSDNPTGWQNHYGYPLNMASGNCNQKIVKELLKKGAYINSYDYYNSTPLIASVKEKCFDVVKILIENGASINLRDALFDFTHLFTGFTPLEYASINGDYKIVKYLIDHGSNINDLHIIPLVLALRNKNWKVAKLLIQHGADVNLFNPILYAVENKNILDMLLTKGANINVVEEDNNTILFEAIENNPEIVPYLVKIGAKKVANVKHYGKTALMKAAFDYVRKYTASAAYKALRSVTNTNLKDKNNCTARAYLIYGRHGENGYDAELIKSEFYTYDSFLNHFYVNTFTSKDIKECKYGYINPDDIVVDNNDDALLLILKLLLNTKYYSISHKFNYDYDYSLLHIVAKHWKNHQKSIKFLVKEKGIPVDITDKYGNTPLMYAIYYWEKRWDNPKLDTIPNINTLIELGANVNHKNSNGDTPLMLAISQKHPKLVKLLIEKGASIDSSAFNLALKVGNKEIINLLKKKTNSF